MKLSQMNTEELACVLCRLAGPLCRIGQDERVNAAIAGMEKKRPIWIRLSGALEKLIPLLLDEHLSDAAEALSILTGKEKETIMGQSALVTFQDIRDCADQELLDFFASPGRARKAGSCRLFTGTARRGARPRWKRCWPPKKRKRHGGAASWPS